MASQGPPRPPKAPNGPERTFYSTLLHYTPEHFNATFYIAPVDP